LRGDIRNSGAIFQANGGEKISESKNWDKNKSSLYFF
jgi:hypothetical protein